MRIALVIERFEPRGGEMATVAPAVVHALAASGDDATIFAGRAAPSTREPPHALAFSATAPRAWRGGGSDAVQTSCRSRHRHVYRAGRSCHAASIERTVGPLPARMQRLTACHPMRPSPQARIFAAATKWVLYSSVMARRGIAERHHVAEEFPP